MFVLLLIVRGTGVAYFDECPVEHYIPIYLVIGGGLSLFEDISALMQSVCLCQQNDPDDDEESQCQPEDREVPEDGQSHRHEDPESEQAGSQQVDAERGQTDDEREPLLPRQKDRQEKRPRLSKAVCGSESFVGSIVTLWFAAGEYCWACVRCGRPVSYCMYCWSF